MPVTEYIWDEVNDTVLMETDGAGNTTAEYTHEPGPFGGLISERRGNGSRYYHFDALGSTRQLTDATGQVTDSFTYDAFGNTVQSTGASVVPYHFVGRSGYYFDQELAEYYVRARHYSVGTTRWVSLDPIGLGSGDVNLYKYVQNSPVSRIDAPGLIDTEDWPLPPGSPSGNLCEKKDVESVKATLTDVCNFINGDGGKKCIGPNLRNCLQSLCSGTIMIKCLKKCVSWDLCASAEIYDIDGKKNGTVTGDYPHINQCSPIVPSKPSHKLGILICLTKTVAGNPGYPNGCGSSGRATILHELTHHCGLLHIYDSDKGQGQPEACERACFRKDINPKYWRFRDTPESCQCECTPRGRAK